MKTAINLPSIVIDDKPHRVEIEIELTDDGKFSVCGGVYRSKYNHYFQKCERDYIMCGQCLDELAQYPIIKNNSKLKQVYEWWKKWHLNDLHAGTEKQEQALEDAGMKNWANEYSKCCDYLESIGLLYDNGYKFGTSWLKREIPTEIQEQMRNFIKENYND